VLGIGNDAWESWLRGVAVAPIISRIVEHCWHVCPKVAQFINYHMTCGNSSISLLVDRMGYEKESSSSLWPPLAQTSSLGQDEDSNAALVGTCSFMHPFLLTDLAQFIKFFYLSVS
jgi:hypothetical protein